MTQEMRPEDCGTMDVLRGQIDLIDLELVSLLARRMAYIDRAIDLKQAEGLPARIPHRVEEVVANARRAAERDDLDPELVETIWRRLIDWSIDREAQVIRRE